MTNPVTLAATKALFTRKRWKKRATLSERIVLEFANATEGARQAGHFRKGTAGRVINVEVSEDMARYLRLYASAIAADFKGAAAMVLKVVS